MDLVNAVLLLNLLDKVCVGVDRRADFLGTGRGGDLKEVSCVCSGIDPGIVLHIVCTEEFLIESNLGEVKLG